MDSKISKCNIFLPSLSVLYFTKVQNTEQVFQHSFLQCKTFVSFCEVGGQVRSTRLWFLFPMAEKIYPGSRKIGAVYGAVCIIWASLHWCPGSRLARRELELKGKGEGGKREWARGEDFSDWEPAVRNWGKNFPMGNETPLFNSINVSLSNEWESKGLW